MWANLKSTAANDTLAVSILLLTGTLNALLNVIHLEFHLGILFTLTGSCEPGMYS
jgi:hypothetical protein